ncbi:hypothetical protein YC2023_050726 [Brassica napus]
MHGQTPHSFGCIHVSLALLIFMYPPFPQFCPHEFFTTQYLVPSSLIPYPTIVTA